jgi:hypothetical protein
MTQRMLHLLRIMTFSGPFYRYQKKQILYFVEFSVRIQPRGSVYRSLSTKSLNALFSEMSSSTDNVSNTRLVWFRGCTGSSTEGAVTRCLVKIQPTEVIAHWLLKSSRTHEFPLMSLNLPHPAIPCQACDLQINLVLP